MKLYKLWLAAVMLNAGIGGLQKDLGRLEIQDSMDTFE